MDASWFTPDRQATLSYVGLRRSVGVIAILLPFVLPLGTALLFHERLPAPISGYYYTDIRGVFVGSMWAIGAFLLSYRFGRLDTLVGSIAGISAIGLSLFPTTPDDVQSPTGWVRIAGALHWVFAVVLFAMLAVFCLVLFVRSGPDPTEQKKVRNGIYRACGVVIVISAAGAAAAHAVLEVDAQEQWRPVFWLEAIAVLAFGVSWFVKGETLFRDAPGTTRPRPPSAQAAA